MQNSNYRIYYYNIKLAIYNSADSEKTEDRLEWSFLSFNFF